MLLWADLCIKPKIWADHKIKPSSQTKRRRLKLPRYHSYWHAVSALIHMWSGPLPPFRPRFLSSAWSVYGRITYPLKVFCSRVRHSVSYTVLHQPTARWNIFIKFIPFIASVLIYMYGTYYSPWKNVCQPGMGGIFDRTLKKLIFPECNNLIDLIIFILQGSIFHQI